VNRNSWHLGALLLLVGCSTTGGFHLNSGAILGERGPAPSPTDFGESPLVMPPIPPKTATASDSTPSDSDAAPAAASTPATATTAPATTTVAKAAPPAAKAPKASAKAVTAAAAPATATVAAAATTAAKPPPPTKLAVANVKSTPGVTAPQGGTSDSEGAAPAVDAKGWSTLSPKTGGAFHVDMPAERLEKDDTVDVGDKSAKLHAWFAKAGDGSVYTASVIQMAGATDSTLHDVGQGLASGCGGTVTTEAATHLGTITGIRVVIQCKDKSTFIARLYRAHGAIFEVGIMRKAGSEPTASSAEELGRFFDSFAIL
jgi:hypothetical protein